MLRRSRLAREVVTEAVWLWVTLALGIGLGTGVTALLYFLFGIAERTAFVVGFGAMVLLLLASEVGYRTGWLRRGSTRSGLTGQVANGDVNLDSVLSQIKANDLVWTPAMHKQLADFLLSEEFRSITKAAHLPIGGAASGFKPAAYPASRQMDGPQVTTLLEYVKYVCRPDATREMEQWRHYLIREALLSVGVSSSAGPVHQGLYNAVLMWTYRSLVKYVEEHPEARPVDLDKLFALHFRLLVRHIVGAILSKNVSPPTAPPV